MKNIFLINMSFNYIVLNKKEIQNVIQNDLEFILYLTFFCVFIAANNFWCIIVFLFFCMTFIFYAFCTTFCFSFDKEIIADKCEKLTTKKPSFLAIAFVKSEVKAFADSFFSTRFFINILETKLYFLQWINKINKNYDWKVFNKSDQFN